MKCLRTSLEIDGRVDVVDGIDVNRSDQGVDWVMAFGERMF